ncbi:MAG TPA: hypothetical protein VLF87_00310 [Patescibacteria group bacterium]|nr:hypothetical protein [Patescibacteria group bacterium]
MANQNKTSNTVPTKNNQPAKHHFVRTTFATLFGMLAVWLILASIVVVWLNRTLTDTSTYVKTVSPLVTKPEVQNFIAQKASEQLVNNAPITDIASTLLPADQITGKTPDQLKPLVQSAINDDIKQVVSTPQFAKLWQTTNQTAHTQLIQQIKAGAPTLTLDLHPAIVGAIDQLKSSKLSAVSDKIDISEDAGKIELKGSGIEKVHQYYDTFQKATLALVLAAIVLAALCIWISVHHMKTLRRMLIMTAISVLILALALRAPSFVHLKTGDPVQTQAAITIAETLLRNLQLAALVLGIGCIVIAIATKLYERFVHR